MPWSMDGIATPFTGFFGGLLLGLSYADFAIPIGLGFWFLLLRFRMNETDCSNPYSAAVYVSYCTFAGVFLVVAIPSRWLGEVNFKFYLTWTVIFVALSSLRWSFEYMKQAKESNPVEQKQKEEVDG